MKKTKVPHWSEKNRVLFAPHDPDVGKNVCLGCLPIPAFRRGRSKGLKPFPHSFIKGICRFKEPGVAWTPSLEPGEEEYLARRKREDREVPF